MMKYIPTGVIFQNRKQAIHTMGENRYRRELAAGNFEFPERIENNENKKD